jgi:transglutaminase-like putative cysteine protease
MILRRPFLAAVVVLLLAFAALAQQPAPQPKERHFRFTYDFTVRNAQDGKKVRVWFPHAQSDPYQKIEVISATGDLPLKTTSESEYGNTIYYAEASGPLKPEYHFSVVYDVTRYERVALENGKFVAKRQSAKPAELRRFLQPDKLVPVTGLPAELAAKETAGKQGTMEKAHAIYNYVFANMKYDKSGTGWGRGDTLWACDSKHGNCTDFHSLFDSMARSQQIPARFMIGFGLPTNTAQAEVAGYHCWSDFYVNGDGWVPVDISEAWKHQELKDYFFGAHDVNRVQFSVGRDIKLNPAQDGEPLNYFVYPYVEVDGKKFENVKNAFSFADEPVKTERAAR